jgi:hypothetical protein
MDKSTKAAQEIERVQKALRQKGTRGWEAAYMNRLLRR